MQTSIPTAQQQDPEQGHRSRGSYQGLTALVTAVAAILATTSIVISVKVGGTSDAALTAADKALRETSDISNSVPGNLEQGQKLCRVLKDKGWRDGLIVPRNWTISLCVDYQKKTAGNGYQLGCIYKDGTTLGGENGTLPSPNCGWQ